LNGQARPGAYVAQDEGEHRPAFGAGRLGAYVGGRFDACSLDGRLLSTKATFQMKDGPPHSKKRPQGRLFSVKRYRKWLLVVAVGGLFVLLSAINRTHFQMAAFHKGKQSLLERSRRLANEASPRYQDIALAKLPENPNNGPVFRFDDRLSQATVLEGPQELTELSDSAVAHNMDLQEVLVAQGESRLAFENDRWFRSLEEMARAAFGQGFGFF
jgi:hypothetical protein